MQCRWILFLVLGCCSFVAKAQYTAFEFEDAVWSEYTFVDNASAGDQHVNYSYSVVGDTVIDQEQYHKVYLTEESGPTLYAGAIQERNRKVWFYPGLTSLPYESSFPSDTAAFLLYDFSDMHIGASLILMDGNTIVNVTGIDSLLIGNTYRNRYTIDNPNSLTTEYWIEGLGSTKGLLFPAGFDFEWTSYLLCMETPAFTYRNSAAPGLYCTYEPISSNLEEERANNFRFGPNPSTGSVTVWLPEDESQVQLTVYNTLGEIVVQEQNSNNQVQLNTSGWAAGMYLIQMRGNKTYVPQRLFVR